MVELGQLEAQHAEFTRRNTRIVAVSLDRQEDAVKTQSSLPHLQVVGDAQGNLCSVVDLIGPHSGPDGNVTVSPTTILVDRRGIVRWLFRPDRYLERLTPQELLAAVDTHLGTTP